MNITRLTGTAVMRYGYGDSPLTFFPSLIVDGGDVVFNGTAPSPKISTINDRAVYKCGSCLASTNPTDSGTCEYCGNPLQAGIDKTGYR